MDYLYKLRSAVSTVKSTVESALPGNPISREYESVTAVASAGPALCWTIYDGYKKSSKQEVSIWWLEKRHIEKWPQRDRDMFLEIVKRGIQQLTRLRHPKLLVIEHALEESKDSLAFCTEPVLASLANILYPPSTYGPGINDDMSTTGTPAISEAAANELKNFSLEDVEIKMGFKEVVEALRFLHFDARMIHRNIRPESIIITKRNAWKLCGFEFCLASVSSPDQSPSFPNVDYDTQCPSFARPQLDFSAPELPLGGRVDVASDIYSLGLVLYSVFNKGKRLFEYKDDMSAFRKNSDNMRTLAPGKLISVPESIRDDLKLCLQFTPELRPDAAQLVLIKYFEDPNVKTLANLESLRLIDGMEKANFFKTLPSSFSAYSKRVLTRRVLPALADEMRVHPQTVPMVLPSILQASELLDPREFSKFALPALEPVLQLERAYQAWHLILQKVDMIQSKLSPEDSRRLLVPMACNALDSDSAALHETCAQCLHKLTPLIDSDTMRKRVVPRLLALATDMNVLSVRINALLCFGRMLDNLEKWQVTEQILPALAKIQSRDPAVLMAVLGVFRLAFNCAKLGGLGRDICAKVCLPFLVTSCVEQALNGRQFEAYMSLIRDMLNKVETEQRRRLEQAPSSGNEDGGGGTNNTANHSADFKGSNNNLASLAPTPVKPSSEKKTGGALSLEDKRRLANEQEKTLQLRQSTPLEPMNTKSPSTTPSTSTSSMFTGLLPSPPAPPPSSNVSSTTSSSLSSIMSPQNFSMVSPPPPSQSSKMVDFSSSSSSMMHQSKSPMIPSSTSKPSSSIGGDPFASLNAFAMTSSSSTSTSSTVPNRIPNLTSPIQQQSPSVWPGIRPPPPPPVSQSMSSMGGGPRGAMIPPPPAPNPGAFVNKPAGSTGINWNQGSMMDGFGKQKQQQPAKTENKPRAQDDLADLLG